MRLLQRRPLLFHLAALLSWALLLDHGGAAPQDQPGTSKAKQPPVDGKHVSSNRPDPVEDPEYQQYGIYAQTAPRAPAAEPATTTLPLELRPGDRICYIGNTLLERSRHFGHFETLLHQTYPEHKLVVRNLCWPADTVSLRPRPANFADLDQHLTHERADVVFASFGFNESFAGAAGLDEFRHALASFLAGLQSKAFNGDSAPSVVLISPIANENVASVAAADRNNARLRRYVDAMHGVAEQQGVAFVDVFTPTLEAMADDASDLTFNGVHLLEAGYEVFARAMFNSLVRQSPPSANPKLRQAIVDKNRQFFRRYRPANTFYYTGDRNQSYGFLDFLPAMKNFDIMAANRDRRIWALASGKSPPDAMDDANVPPLPRTKESRGANQWMSAADERNAFQIDPRFEVTLFAGEEEFPDIAAPIQMRWDGQGRLWVSCSTTYPHVYPGQEPNDKLVILEDTDGDGKADKSSVFADDLHIPLSFEFGDGGVYVSEMPHLTFIKDTDGDGKADVRRRLLTGFGTEDSHHALHDFTWTPDGDLIFREGIFHHSQVETPYGPVRQQNSGWFRFQPRTHRLLSFGTYHSTNPWGVTFDDWGQHVASHPIYAAAFHSLDPPYPGQHPRPAGLRAYSGTCGQEFIDFDTFPDELRGCYVKVRYKPTNRVEIHRWQEGEFGYDEEYLGDLLFSRNLSFIPVDVRFGPRGALYVCDWYNPVKGHAQYSLRDTRRDRHSGRIWRITTKGRPPRQPPTIAGAPIPDLLDILKRREYRYRYWAKRELRERDPAEVQEALDRWVAELDAADPRFRHHQTEAIWTYRTIDAVNADLLRELLACDNHHARAAATQQLRYWHAELPDAIDRLRLAANDPRGLVRMEAVIAASYIGTRAALDAVLDVLKYPREAHLAYAVTCALNSHTLRRHWEDNPTYQVARLLNEASQTMELREPAPSASQAQFDTQQDLKIVRISCLPERMQYTRRQFVVRPGQPVKLVFTNPDATDHNLLIVQPGALEEVGMAANEMAKDPRHANSNFIPESKRPLVIQACPMIGPTRRSRVHVLRFTAPTEPGLYPFVCTFPGHWVIMNGVMAVANDLKHAQRMLAERQSPVVRQWTMTDFPSVRTSNDELSIMRGMQAFIKARCNQCHVVAGHGIGLGPDLTEVRKRFTGKKLLRQILEPSAEIHQDYQTWQLVEHSGRVVSGVIKQQDDQAIHVIPNLLTPETIEVVDKRDVDFVTASKVSSMPQGMADMLTGDEIIDLLSFLEAGGYQAPRHLDQHQHSH